jgi:alkanesulfonate monooxygenase SsuD/methylene tetrahydromethanopterin reductase-like flavin-dependent oxidoreductase (luciferase family)
MTTTLIGADEAELERRVAAHEAWTGRPVDRAEAASSWIFGTVEQAVERLRAYAQAGVSRVYLQHLVYRDLAAVLLIGRELVPAVR